MSDAAQPVAELFAALGFKVDKKSLDQANGGLNALTAIAERAVAAVESLSASFARLGAVAGAAGGAVPLAEGAIPPSLPVPAPAPEHKKKHGGHGHGGEHGHGEHGHVGRGARGLAGLFESTKEVAEGFLAVFAGHEVLEFTHELTEAGVQAKQTASMLGLSTDAVQQLQYAAGNADVSKEDLSMGLRFLQVNAVQAQKGVQASAGAFQTLGLSVHEANGQIKPVDQLFSEVADKLSGIQDPAKRTAIAVQLFGRSGQMLLPLLNQGAEGIAKFREEAEALGGGLNETLIENAEKYDSNVKRLSFAFLGVKSAIGNALLPVMTALAEKLTTSVGYINYAYRHTKIFQTLMAVGVFVAIVKVAKAIRALGREALIAWAESIAGFIGIAVIIAVIALSLEDLYQAMTGGKSVIGKWIDNWQGMGTTAELVKNIAAGIKTIRVELEQFAHSPAQWMLDKLAGIAQPGSVLGDYLVKNGLAKRAQLGQTVDAINNAAASQDEQANRAVANGRGVGASARSNIDIPRAEARGLGAHAAQSFGQARAGGIFGNPNGDSVVINVNAHTNANPKEIAHHVKQEIVKHQERTNRNLHRALVPQPASE